VVYGRCVVAIVAHRVVVAIADRRRDKVMAGVVTFGRMTLCFEVLSVMTIVEAR